MASIVTTSIPIIFNLCGRGTLCLGTVVDEDGLIVSVLSSMNDFVAQILLVAYCLARLALIEIAFSSFRSMPGDAYLTLVKVSPHIQL